MRLWIDGQCLQTASRQRGIGRYVGDFVRAIAGGDFGIELLVSFNAAMPDEAISARDHVKSWIPDSNIHLWEGVAESGEADSGYTERRHLSEVTLSHHVACLAPDVALSTSPFEGAGDLAVPLPPMPEVGIPIAAIFYDAIPHHYADQYLSTPLRRAYYYRRLGYYKSFDLNLCISDYSLHEAIGLSGNDKSLNIGAGVSPEFLQYSQTRTPRAAKAYVLNVGSLDWRKNVETLIDAFGRLPDNLRNELQLFLAGDYHSTRVGELRERWIALGLPEQNLVSKGHVSDADLVRLYQSAGLVVQPSLLEGFGLTALEAMTCGAPVIVSSTGALPEIVNDQDLLFDPTRADQIADRIVSVLGDETRTARKVNAGLERARRYSWENSARLAVSGLSRIGGSRKSKAPQDLQSVRQRTAKVLTRLAVPLPTIVEAVARAEPDFTDHKRLLVEATSIVRRDLGTGIQRVTREMVRNLICGPSLEKPTIVYCDGLGGFYDVQVTTAPFALRKSSNKLFLGRGDTVFMLDSSWEFYREVLPVLLSARMRGAEVISCLYDLVPLRQNAFCHPGVPPIFLGWFKAALSYSTGFVCISKTVADELHDLLQAISFPRELKIGYWPLGADFTPSGVAERPIRNSSNRRFSLLMVGTIEPRKGYRVALDACEMLWKDGLDIQLTIIGKAGWEADELIDRLRNHPSVGDRLRWHWAADDEQLARAYEECDALIASSFAEGFGLPIVEALHYGKSVIASDIPIFREVTRDHPCRYFQVGSPASLASSIRSLIAEHQDDRSRGVRPASWSESAARLQDVVSNGEWYRIYKPCSYKPYSSIYDYGKTIMQGPLDEAGRRHTLELVHGPIRDKKNFRYILRITNLSKEVWSSSAAEDSWKVRLGYHLRDASGGELIPDAAFGEIAFVLVPGDSQFLSLELPRQAVEAASSLEVEMLQGESDWWGVPLWLPLSIFEMS
ncbi:glycosyltransferase family 1 protein [uncultured Bradyrhizobium sp.]|jgi:glycosyltransferase involved in cell wall biosynthesis|uniref:glycosyltransferase family 4 protein n=1 Tax=uncultured Bradyrhizobium sp. TaxID=199684 RepID=UPI00261E95A5|nr:glycosyltransferase family 1 protein [uncultured Bradyrhizobium sp.]